jgi:hypothetical protein
MMMAMVMATIALAACQHTESAGSRSPSQSRGAYGGVEGGPSF